MDLDFSPHARMRMRRRQIPETAVYHVVADYDRRLDHADRVEYFGTWKGATFTS